MKRDFLADILKTFVFSLGQGLQESAKYPGARGTRAGQAASLQAPYVMEQLEQKRKQDEEERALRMSQIQQTIANQQNENASRAFNAAQGSMAPETPLNVPRGMSVDPRAQGQVFQGDTQQGPEQLPPINFGGGNVVRPQSAQDIQRMALEMARAKQPPPTQDTSIQPFDVWRKQNPDKPVEDWVKLNRTPKETEPAEDYLPLVEALEKSPERYNDLTPTIQAKIIPELTKRGFKFPAAKPANTGLEDMRQFQRAATLRDDYNKESQAFRDREDMYKLIQAIKEEPSGGPSDIVLIYNFVKLNDPNAAREGELELVQRGASIPDTWRRYAAQFLSGNVLGPEQRKKMLAAADRLYKTGIQPALGAINKRYEDTAKRYGVDPRDVVRPSANSGISDKPPSMTLPNGRVVKIQPDGTYK